jgi:hypothetical protein
MRHVILFLLLLGSLASCSYPVYKTPPPSSPLFSEAGEFSARAGLSFSALSSASVAYALTDHFSVLADAQFDPVGKSQSMQFEGESGSYMADLGVGTQHRINRNTVVNAFAGFGVGAARTRGLSVAPMNQTEYIDRQASFQQYWMQASIGISDDEDVETAYQLRATYLHFTGFRETKYGSPPESGGLLTSITDSHADHQILEHSLIVRGGHEVIRGFWYLTVAHALRSFDGLHTPVNMGVGLELLLK